MMSTAKKQEKLIPELWEPRPRLKRCPFGFMDTGDPDFFYPDPVVTVLLEEGFTALNNGLSLREVANWINSKLPEGKSITHQGLRTVWGERYRTRPIGPPVPKPKGKTLEEQKAIRRKKKIADEKKSLAHRLKRISRLEEEVSGLLSTPKGEPEVKSPVFIAPVTTPVARPDTKELYSVKVPEEQKKKEVIFKPNDGPQTEFLQAWEQEVLYGGAAGGGKSYALLADPIRYFSNPEFRGLLLRRTNDELKELKWKSRGLYDNPIVKGTWREKDSLWRFPSGAEFWLTYLERDEDVMRYQGQSFTWIGIDELTQYSSPFAWDYLRSRLRSTDPSLPLSMRASSNPGGPGHGWVKRMFIEPAPSNTTFNARDLDTGEEMVHSDVYHASHPLSGQPNPKAGQPLFQRRFIPAKLYDNPYLTKDDNYEASLLSLPEMQRRRLLEGDWSVAEGAAFSEFRQSVHVIKPFKIPPSWRKFRSCDFGYSSHSAVHWYAVDPSDDSLVVYRELYVSKVTGRELGLRILELEKNEKISYGVLDSSVWNNKDGGPTIAEEILRTGCQFRPSDRSPGSRIAGKNRLHELLKINEEGKAGIYFFDTCRQIISDLPVIPMDPKGGEDIDDRYTSDHAYDSIRYGIQSRPRSTFFYELYPSAAYQYRPSDSSFGY